MRAELLLAAGAVGRAAIDGVWLDLADHGGLAAEAREAALMGCRDKAAVHPSQVSVIRAAFRPEDADVERARRVLIAADATDGGCTAPTAG